MKTIQLMLLFGFSILSFHSYSNDFIWSTVYGGPSTDYIHEMITDNEDNIYIVGGFYDSITISGQIFSTENYLDAYIMKLNSNGQLLWFKNFGGPIWDMAIDIKFDNEFEHMYVTGFFEEEIQFETTHLISKGDIDMYIAKFDMDGNVIWAKNGGGSWMDYGYCLAVDENDDIYLSGMFESAFFEFDGVTRTSEGGTDIFLMKINSDGELIWMERAGGSGFDKPVDMIIESGNLLILGSFNQHADFGGLNIYGYNDDLFLARYSLNAEILWVSAAHCEASVIPKALTVCQGDYYICGLITDDTQFGDIELQLIGAEDIFIAKADFLGAFKWAKNFGGSDFNAGYDISATADNMINMTGAMMGTVNFEGTILTSNGYSDAFFSQFNQEGNINWVFQLGNDDDQYGDDGRVMIENSMGQMLIGGRFTADINLGGNTYPNYGGRDIFISYLDQTTSVNQNTESTQLFIYPNPVIGDVIHVCLADDAIIQQVQVINSQGEILLESLPGSNQFQIIIDKLNNGIYFLHLKTGKENIVKRFIRI